MAEVSQSLPLLLKFGWTAIVVVILYVYWREYGPENFLWFSDIALIGLCLALWLENPLLAAAKPRGEVVPPSHHADKPGRIRQVFLRIP
jgi:hypothetical protein